MTSPGEIRFQKAPKGQYGWRCNGQKGGMKYRFFLFEMPEGNYRLGWVINSGRKGTQGNVFVTDMAEASAMATEVLDNCVLDTNIKEHKVAPRRFEEDWFDEGLGPDCPNCGEQKRIFSVPDFRIGVFRCERCGCVFDRWNEKILFDMWDHDRFDEYRDLTEDERIRRFKDGEEVYAYHDEDEDEPDGLFAYTPEAFDSDQYSALVNYENPKDRSRILNFSLRGRGKTNIPGRSNSGRRSSKSKAKTSSNASRAGKAAKNRR